MKWIPLSWSQDQTVLAYIHADTGEVRQREGTKWVVWHTTSEGHHYAVPSRRPSKRG